MHGVTWCESVGIDIAFGGTCLGIEGGARSFGWLVREEGLFPARRRVANERRDGGFRFDSARLDDDQADDVELRWFSEGSESIEKGTEYAEAIAVGN